MNLLQNLILVGIILGFAVVEIVTRSFRDHHATAGDRKIDLGMFVLLVVFTQPFIFAVTGRLCALAMPSQHGAWDGLPWWAMAALLLVGDDFTQYLWHRVSHSPLLWPLHRAH